MLQNPAVPPHKEGFDITSTWIILEHFNLAVKESIQWNYAAWSSALYRSLSSCRRKIKIM
jgi:hypothetical protein